jgi:hypothetical protein
VAERGELTSWRAQADGQVRTRKGNNRVRGTHEGVQTDEQVRTWEESDRARVLTCWRAEADRQMRTQKESGQVRHTHFLESTGWQTSEDTEGK